MIIYVDVDGTLTTEQRDRSAFKSPPRQDVIDKVKRMIELGHEVVIWTGNTGYARRVCELYGIPAVAAVRKPDLIVDNECRRWSRRLKDRVILPEQFLDLEENGMEDSERLRVKREKVVKAIKKVDGVWKEVEKETKESAKLSALEGFDEKVLKMDDAKRPDPSEDIRHHSTLLSAERDFADAVARVVAEERWMGALWRVKDGKIDLAQVTTYCFPTVDFLAAIGHLASHLFEMAKNTANALPNDPLPPAVMPWMQKPKSDPSPDRGVTEGDVPEEPER